MSGGVGGQWDFELTLREHLRPNHAPQGLDDPVAGVANSDSMPGSLVRKVNSE